VNNPRITAKDRGLIKGALRRAFARSELHERVTEAARIGGIKDKKTKETWGYQDPSKPRCKKWIRCAVCGLPSPEWSSAVDHIVPVVKIDSSFSEMSLDEAADAMWCDESNLQKICVVCHDKKSALEKEAREESKIARGLKKPSKKRRVKV
jgi:5-methylcytosine-specific restriction endonuclease McrA